MSEKELIPCRVCGKLFKPCGYCQSHSDIFRWRNFACSRECAAEYMSDAIAYRRVQRNRENESKTPLQTTGYQTYSAAEQRGI